MCFFEAHTSDRQQHGTSRSSAWARCTQITRHPHLPVPPWMDPSRKGRIPWLFFAGSFHGQSQISDGHTSIRTSLLFPWQPDSLPAPTAHLVGPHEPPHPSVSKRNQDQPLWSTRCTACPQPDHHHSPAIHRGLFSMASLVQEEGT